MLVVGIAFLLFAGVMGFFHATVLASAVVTGVVLLGLGLMVGERFPTR